MTGPRWEHASAWPHWCGLAQVANVAEPHGVIRIWDPTVREWFWMGPGRDDAVGQQTIREVHDAWYRVRRLEIADQWVVSWFKGLSDTTPKIVERTLDELVDRLTRHTKAGKDSLPLWSPAVYQTGATRRCAEQVESVGMLVLDYDDGTDIETAIGTWGPWAHIIYTTPSHSTDAPRFRVVLPLAQEVPVKDWKRVWRWAEQRTGQEVDRKCKDPCRMYWGHGGEDPTVARVSVSLDRPLLWFDVERLPAEPVKPRWTPLDVPKRTQPVSVYQATDEAERLLRTCPDTRRRAGEMAGGTITDDSVRHVVCPKCGRPSVWWPFTPAKVSTAMCNHRDSCDWQGSIAEVLP